MNRKEYEKTLRALQIELCGLQEWVKEKGLRVIVVFEGRDAAGKGGVIKAITERVSPRVFRIVALPTPTDREKSEMYVQRYIQHFPAGGDECLNQAGRAQRPGCLVLAGRVAACAARHSHHRDTAHPGIIGAQDHRFTVFCWPVRHW